MAWLLLGIIGLSAFLIFFFILQSARETFGPTMVSSFSTVVFSLWLVSCAVWGSYFYSVRIPGLFDFNIDRAFLALIIGILLIGWYRDRVTFGAGCSIEVLMLLFLIACLASLFLHGFKPALSHYPSPINIFITGYFFPFFALLFAGNYLINKTDLSLVFHVIFYFSVYLVIIAFLEFYNLRQFVFPRYINDPEILLHLDRARGPFLNAAFNGLAINLGFICGLHLLAFKQGFQRLWYILLLALFFPAVFFTQTRSVYLTFTLTLACFVTFYRTSFPKLKVLAVPMVLVFLFVLVRLDTLTSRERREGGIYQVEEVETRFGLIRRSVVMFLDNPVFGVGLGQFVPTVVQEYRGKIPLPANLEEQIQHNHILGLMVELGIVGASFYLMMVAGFFRRLVRLAEMLPERGFVSVNLLVVIAVALAVCLGSNLFVEPSYCLYANVSFFLFGGIANGLYRHFCLQLR